ncbi:MAG: alpha/beta hydrolase [Pseudomonadota bacterium]
MTEVESAFDQGRSVFVSAPDGLKLHVRIWGEEHREQGTPIFCLHGLTRNSRDFSGLATYLAAHAKQKRTIYALDLRGRGLSEYAKDWQQYDLFTELGDVIAVLTALGLEHCIFIGTSRGGLLTMLLGAARPGALKAAIINDVGPVLDGTGLAQIKLYLQRPQLPRSFPDAIAIQKSVMGKAFSAFSEEDWAFEANARYRQINGKLRFDYDPKLSKTMEAYDLDQPIPTMWPQWLSLRQIPTMVVRGENTALLSAETLKAMGAVHKKMQTVTAGGQGHAPMLHRPDVAKHLTVFLDECS